MEHRICLPHLDINLPLMTAFDKHSEYGVMALGQKVDEQFCRSPRPQFLGKRPFARRARFWRQVHTNRARGICERLVSPRRLKDRPGSDTFCLHSANTTGSYSFWCGRQLDLQALHRVRERLVSQRTGVINQIRAFLLERGVAVRQGLRFLRAALPNILAAPSETLSPRMARTIEDLAGDWRRLDERIKELSSQIES